MPIGLMPAPEFNDTNAVVPWQTALESGLETSKKLADVKEKNAKANLPFGGATVPGPAGQIVGLEMVRQRFGEDSPQYKSAMKAFDLQQSSTGSRINYQDTLSNSMPIRYTTNEGKKLIEQSNVNQGYSPAGTPEGQVIAPGQAPYHAPSGSGVSPSESYSLQQTRANLPQFVMQRNLFANNIDKTLEDINLDNFTAYNGIGGHAELVKEKAKDLAGQPTSEKYKKYVEAENKFNFLTGQVRQFYGDSIQPSAMEKLQSHLDPRGWRSSETGKTGYNSAASLLRKELQTYRDASKNSNVYTGQGSSNAPINAQPQTGVPEGKIEAVGKGRDGSQRVKINGKWYKV